MPGHRKFGLNKPDYDWQNKSALFILECALEDGEMPINLVGKFPKDRFGNTPSRVSIVGKLWREKQKRRPKI